MSEMLMPNRPLDDHLEVHLGSCDDGLLDLSSAESPSRPLLQPAQRRLALGVGFCIVTFEETFVRFAVLNVDGIMCTEA